MTLPSSNPRTDLYSQEVMLTQEDEHTFAFLGYDEVITNLNHLVEILGWKLEPIGDQEAHVLINQAGHKVLLVQRFNHALLGTNETK
jgi:hypothetical protein